MSGEKTNSKIIILGIICLIIIVVALSYAYNKPYQIVLKKLESEKIIASTSIKVFIVGDIMLDRDVRNTITRKGFDYYFSGVKDVLRSADIAVANLEGPFTIYPSLTASLKNKALQFTFEPALAPALADLGFDVLGLANNHTLNFGNAGLEMTRRYIGSSGMSYYGDPNNVNELSTIITKNGIKVGFIGFHEFTYLNYNKVFEEIDRVRPKVDILIISPHWGIEYDTKPTDLQRKWAHQFIDSGVDAVIGAHSHVIGEIEEYQGKKIFYSLGNFAFDQYFSDATMNGLGVILDVEKGNNKINLTYRTIPIRTDREGTRVTTSTKVIPARGIPGVIPTE